MWFLDWSPKEDQLIARYKKRKVMPEALKNKPKLNAIEEWFFKAFSTLRNGTITGSPISVQSIFSYVQNIGSIVDTEQFLDIVQAMDTEVLKRSN